MKASNRRLALLVLFFSLSAVTRALGQGSAGPTGYQPSQGSNMPHSTVTDMIATNGTVVDVTVNSGKHNLDRQAVVQLVNKSTNAVHSQVTQDDSTARVLDLQAGMYDLQVSAVGFVTSHQEVALTGRIEVRQIEVTLEKDASAVDLGAVKTRELPNSVRKDMLHGVAALESGKLDAAQKKLDSAYSHDPTNPDVAFLLGYLYFQKKDFQKARTYLLDATK